MQDDGWKVSQSAPVGPQLYRGLRDRIIRNDLVPGSRISETEIATAVAVSRQPVREAFIKLAEEGLLEVRPQRGTYVRKISIRAALSARFIREATEADIVRLLAADPEPDLLHRLTDQLARQTEAADRADPQGFIELDELFHRTLAEAAGQAHAWQVLEGLKAQMNRIRHLSAQQFPLEKLLHQHRAIVAAIAAGNPGAADTHMRDHLRAILNDIPAVTQALPDFFDMAEA